MNPLYLDTEYNGFGGSLISMALVDEKEGYFYGVLPYSLDEKEYDPWVWKNVIPVIQVPYTSVVQFRVDLHDFLLRYEGPTIICDWHEDLAHFCERLRGAHYGSSLNFRFSAIVLAETAPQSKLPHNALEDARALREWCRLHPDSIRPVSG